MHRALQPMVGNSGFFFLIFRLIKRFLSQEITVRMRVEEGLGRGAGGEAKPGEGQREMGVAHPVRDNGV